MCSVTVELADLEIAERAVLRIPIGRPRMLLLNWLDELVLVLLLLELLLEPKSDFNRLVRVLVVPLLVSAEATVVSASDALAVWSGVTMQSTAARRSDAMRSGLAVCENEGRECMGCLWLCRPAWRGRGGCWADVTGCGSDGKRGCCALLWTLSVGRWMLDVPFPFSENAR